MPVIVLAVLAVLFGAVVLARSADTLIDSAHNIGVATGLSAVTVGVVIVGFGTSLPEVLISVFAVFEGSADIAISNAYGSNIANIGLITGVTFLFGSATRLRLPQVREDLILLLLLLAIATLPLLDASLGISGSLFLLALLVIYLLVSLLSPRNREVYPPVGNSGHRHIRAEFVRVTVSLLILLLSARVFLWGAVVIARNLGISEVFMGLTMVALGTSLPELATAIAGVRRGESEMILGNIIGSCIFNSLCVVGIAGLVERLFFARQLVARDIPISLIFAASFAVLVYIAAHYRAARWFGILLLTCYGLYIGFLAAEIP